MAGQRKTLGSLVGTAAPAPDAPPASTDKPDRPAKAARNEPSEPARPPAAEGMTMRSWYMPKASADRLAALVDDVHFATRLPKHLIMGALVNVIDRHRAEVEAEARSAAGQ